MTNDAWIPVIEVFDGIEMVLVPPGCFRMGEPGRASAEVCLTAPYWLDRTEVTVGQFSPADASGDPDYPQSGLTYPEAADYCAARGGRLPTEIEWEYAARGPDSLIYPWGNRFDITAVNSNAGGSAGPVTVGTYLNGASWVGALDMAGNLWEWTATVYDLDRYPYPPTNPNDGRDSGSTSTSPQVIRGGSWHNEFFFMQTFSRKGKHPTLEWYAYVGFRCLREIDGH
jgi:formylglycine-generating enzyme required for sulfatase activity